MSKVEEYEREADSESVSESESDEEANFLFKFGGQITKNTGDSASNKNETGEIVNLFEEDFASQKRREQACIHKKRLESRTWGSQSHSTRWAKGDTLHKSFALRNGGDVKYIETPMQQLCVWDCAIVLARYLETHPLKVKDKRIIELGCGVGLPGLVSYSLGAKEVHLTDRPVALLNLTEEIRMNTNTSSIVNEQDCAITANVLEWGHASAAEYQSKTSISSKCTEPCFDVVLCSDLIYAGDSSTTQALVESIVVLTANEQNQYLGNNINPCQVISCHEIRFENSIVQEKLFVEKMIEVGFTKVEYVPFNQLDPECRDEAIKIIQFERE